MGNKLKYFLIVLLFFTITITFFLNIINLYKENRIQTVLNSHTNKLETYYNILSHNQKINSDIIYEQTLDNEKLVSILEQANIAKNKNDLNRVNKLREKAKNILQKEYKYYKKNGILQYHFVFPDNISFLRMHKLSKFGDDLTNIRKDFAYANKKLEIVRGFAQGRTAHAFRNVYPILDKNKKHLGAVEVSFSSELLQDYFSKVNKIHTHFLVRKDIFNSHTWEKDGLILKYRVSSEHKNYMVTMTDEHTVKKCIIENKKRIEPNKKEIDKLIEEGEKFSVYTIFKEKARVTSFYPILHSITKEPVAWIVSYTKDSLIDKTLEVNFYLNILVVLLLLIIFIFIYLQLIHKDILKIIIEEKTEHLSKMNRELEESEHELQLINENLEIKIKEEIEKSRDKDKALFEQTKMASLGEMIGNIAHQWRQPLSVISTTATGMVIQNELDMLTKEQIEEYGENINKNAQFLSKTIDDFRNFIRGSTKKEEFRIKESIKSFLNLIDTSTKKHNIKIDINIQKDIMVTSLKNELNQCLINLFNNSKDIMIDRDIEDKVIQINIKENNENLEIFFYDNGGGVEENIIDKIFEPYFTTKHQSIGTGLGLNMTYRLIVERMNGTILVSNEKFNIEENNYYGALFIIKLPLK